MRIWVILVSSFFVWTMTITMTMTMTMTMATTETHDSKDLFHLISQLQTHQWTSAIPPLEAISRSDPPNQNSSVASLALGDFYIGLTPFPKDFLPPPVNISGAFYFYYRATQFPFQNISKAHFMVAFLGFYHSNHISKEFYPKYRRLPNSAQEEPNSIENNEKELSNSGNLQNGIKTELYPPNIPLIQLHLAASAQSNYTPALLSLGYHFLYGHNMPLSCHKSSEYFRTAAHFLVTTSASRHSAPRLALQTESVSLAKEFSSGKSVSQEEQDVIQYHRYSADSGNVESQVAMGVIFYQGGAGGIEQDYSKAFEYFQMAHKGGDATATAYLGWMYQNGFGTEANNETALELYKIAADRGSTAAQTEIGVMYYNGWVVQKDLEQARKWFEKAAHKSHAEALLYLGRMAFSGIGMTKNYAKARSFFQLSAQGGNLVALYNLGIISSSGFGVIPSCNNAVSFYRKIFERTVLKELVTTAYRLYSQGFYDRALIHYELAAEQGDTLAQLNVGWMYEMDLVNDIHRKDIKRELRFYQMAAEQGSAEGHIKVADYLYYGKLGKSYPETSAIFYRAASELRHAQATFNLGYMHHKGLGLPADRHLAKRYYDLSIEYDAEAFFPATLALKYLSFEIFLEELISKGFLWGIAWDNLAIFLLLALLGFALILRKLLDS